MIFPLLLLALNPQDPDRILLEGAPPPLNNPLKGLVPYAGGVQHHFPHSMEFNYLPLSDLVVGPDRYDWAPLEKLLNDIAGRGHQAIFRVFLEYPGRKTGIPSWLLEKGLKVHRWPLRDRPSTEHETPDYEDPLLRSTLRAFIAALAHRYDGDPRIGFITAGLLGLWGEWHTYPRPELFASKAVQREIMDAYEAGFRKTPVLLRYPAGDHHPTYASNHRRGFGYHDDSFAWATLKTDRKEDHWFYMALLQAAGTEALTKWKERPIGGEIRPEAWGRVFDERPGLKQIQDFRRCVEETHASWLLDSGMFRAPSPDARKKRAEEEVRRMGYVFHVQAVTLHYRPGTPLTVKIEVINQGVAPFYFDWSPELALRTPAGEISPPFGWGASLRGLLPGEPARIWEARVPTTSLESGWHTVLLRVPNVLPKGLPIRFANATQDVDAPGWLTLGRVLIDGKNQ